MRSFWAGAEPFKGKHSVCAAAVANSGRQGAFLLWRQPWERPDGDGVRMTEVGQEGPACFHLCSVGVEPVRMHTGGMEGRPWLQAWVVGLQQGCAGNRSLGTPFLTPRGPRHLRSPTITAPRPACPIGGEGLCPHDPCWVLTPTQWYQQGGLWEAVRSWGRGLPDGVNAHITGDTSSTPTSRLGRRQRL